MHFHVVFEAVVVLFDVGILVVGVNCVDAVVGVAADETDADSVAVLPSVLVQRSFSLVVPLP